MVSFKKNPEESIKQEIERFVAESPGNRKSPPEAGPYFNLPDVQLFFQTGCSRRLQQKNIQGRIISRIAVNIWQQKLCSGMNPVKFIVVKILTLEHILKSN